MPLRDRNLREREVGRIRLGHKGAKGEPVKLEKFRITSADRVPLLTVAELYGGQVRVWEHGGALEYEVYTGANRVPIIVPPQERALTQWYELWSGDGCRRRCDGEREYLADTACKCPKSLFERSQQAKSGRACKPTTRLNVMLKDVPGIGTWRVETHGGNAADTLPGVTEFLAQATERGIYVPAELLLVRQSSRRPGEKPKIFYVPAINVSVTPGQLLSGHFQPAALETARHQIDAGRKALGPGLADAASLIRRIEAAREIDELEAVYREAQAAGFGRDGDAVHARYLQRTSALTAPAPLVGEIVEHGTQAADEAWMHITQAAGEIGWDMTRVREEFAARNQGLSVAQAGAPELRAFLAHLSTQAGTARAEANPTPDSVHPRVKEPS